MTGPPNLVAPAKAKKHEFVSGIYRLLGGCRGHRRSLPLGRHGWESGKELGASENARRGVTMPRLTSASNDLDMEAFLLYG